MNVNVSRVVNTPTALLSALGSVQMGLIAAALITFVHPLLTSRQLGNSARSFHRTIVSHIQITSPAKTFEAPRRQRQIIRAEATVAVMSEVIADYGHAEEDAQILAKAIIEESRVAALDPLLIAAVVKYESSFRTVAVSHKGARGLMQVMPRTETALLKTVDVSDLETHERQLRLGSQYLAELNKRFRGNMYHSLIAYNWGPTNLSIALKRGDKLPSGPVTYAKKILAQQANWVGSVDKQTRLG